MLDLDSITLLDFRGTEEYYQMLGTADIINSTFGKALGGAAGTLYLITDYL